MDTRTRSATPKLPLFALALSVGLAAPASAVQAAPAGKLVPGTEHSPPRFVDEPSNDVRLYPSGPGYGFTVSTLAANAADGDRARLEWKQGGKVLVNTPCRVSLNPDKSAYVTCQYSEKPVTAKGAIDAVLIYIDDADDKEYLLRTYKVTVAPYPGFGAPIWQIVPDDLLGAAWVRHAYPQELNNAVAGHPEFYFWIAGDRRPRMSMRCTVDGTKLPEIKLDDSSDSNPIEATTQPRTGKPIHYRWTKSEARMDVYFGSKSDYGERAKDDDSLFLAEHPGSWVCLVRNEGEVLRELAFTVTDKGFITSDLQTAKGAPLTLSNTAAVELRFPKDARSDGRVRPDAMKKSRGFGLPWPEAPSVKAAHATYPAASGWPDPK